MARKNYAKCFEILLLKQKHQESSKYDRKKYFPGD